ncbi:hypothetical protein [Sporomusa acidovorans]|uniref:Uncharacterized protein n=1 Tax=Sporomusa acidovorans (strain ATCC 49682 / DSM 3132 / Mol) TaxID=1123286 RepID=A0ABZ3J9L9_SPOA4|nr:hypothetical protein [Sporomusa acidovorans]OZC21803.1 hypothetical protein SPACI_18780 [Sporomusa acidovorans DSM 3132]SDD56431.1 hypothetical protein SAMN04488499_100255 [Sporomusa acidovorans]
MDGQYRLFIITIFEKPTFGKLDTEGQSIVEQQAGLLAKKLRYLTGRGPERTKAILMRPGFMVYLIQGLLSRGDRLFAAKSLSNAKCVERIAEHNLHEAFTSIYLADGVTTNNINIIDIENNSSISFVFSSGEFAVNGDTLMSSKVCG